MSEMLEVYKKDHDYMLDIANQYGNLANLYEEKTPEFFADIKKFEEDWNARYKATREKANSIIYGNKEGRKAIEKDRNFRDRSDLYMKVVQRNPKYKNWINFSIAIVACALIMEIVGLINCYCIQIFPRYTEDLRAFFLLGWLGITIYWMLPTTYNVKSLKYDTRFKRFTKRSRADNRWLKKYFKNAINMINAQDYLHYIAAYEKDVEARFEVIDKYNELVSKYNELVNKCNKQAEKLQEQRGLLEDAKKIAEAYKEVVEQRDKLLEENTVLLRQKVFEGNFDD